MKIRYCRRLAAVFLVADEQAENKQKVGHHFDVLVVFDSRLVLGPVAV